MHLLDVIILVLVGLADCIEFTPDRLLDITVPTAAMSVTNIRHHKKAYAMIIKLFA